MRGRFWANIALTQVWSSQRFRPIRLPIALVEQTPKCAPIASLLSAPMTLGNGGNRSLHAPTRANIPTSPYGSRRFRAKWKTRNWRREASISRSDTQQHRPRRELLGKRLSPHGRSGRRQVASRNQRNWSAATVGAMTWRRVSSSGGIADAAVVLANAMGQRRGQGRRRSRSSLATREMWARLERVGPFRSEIQGRD